MSSLEKRLSKKQARQLISDKLNDALVEFRPLLKKKSFDLKIKKASKLFATDLAKLSKRNGSSKKDHEQETADLKPISNE